MKKNPIPAWSIKYALSSGVRRVNVYESDGYYVDSYANSYTRKEVAFSEEERDSKVRELCKRKLASLEKQRAKIARIFAEHGGVVT